VWVSVDFDSKYKILWGETRAHRVPIHERIKKFKTRIYKIIPIFPSLKYQTDASWGGGGDSHCAS
jgi:hypothetical protein